MSIRRRRFLGMTAAAAAAVPGAGAAGLTLSSCSGSSSGGETRLRLLAAEYGNAMDSGASERYWNELILAFRRAHPGITIDLSVVSWDEANDEVTRMAKNGEAPDIAQVPSFAGFAEAEQLYSADDLLSIPTLADFLPGVATIGEIHHTQYGMPFAAGVGRLFLNRELFSRAGLPSRRPPRNWAELRSAATALRDAGVPVPFGLPFGHSQAEAEATMWMLSGGGGLTDSTGSYTIDSPENIATFTWLRDALVGPGLTGARNPGEITRQDVFRGFADGEVGMLFGDPLLMRQAGTGGIDYATAPLPGRDGPGVPTLGEASWVLAFNQRGNRESIGEFLSFVFTTDNVNGFAEHHDLLPVTTPAAEAIRESDAVRHRRLVPFLEDLPGATFYPVSKTSWPRAAFAIAQGIGAAVQPGIDVEAVLTGLQSRVEDFEEAEA